MKFSIHHAATSDRGRVRTENQDNWGAYPEQGLYIVSDGLGGEFAGALASRVVVEALPTLLHKHMGEIAGLGGRRHATAVKKALCELSVQVCEQTKGEPGLEGMGATVVLLLINSNKALVAHMGDSRAYRLRRGRLKRLTKDHSIVQMLLDRGEVSPEEADRHPARGRVTRSVGMPGAPIPELHTLEIREGDTLMLCTDGLSNAVTDEQIRTALSLGTEPEHRSRKLVDLALDAGGKDNVTALVLIVAGQMCEVRSSGAGSAEHD